MAASKRVPPSARPSKALATTAAAPVGLPAQLTRSFVSLWVHFAGKKPTRAHAEVRGNIVTCTLVDAVADFNRSMVGRHRGPTQSGEVELTPADYKREAIAVVGRLTRQRVASFLSSHDRDTDVATEVFKLEPSLARGAVRRRDREDARLLA